MHPHFDLFYLFSSDQFSISSIWSCLSSPELIVHSVTQVSYPTPICFSNQSYSFPSFSSTCQGRAPSLLPWGLILFWFALTHSHRLHMHFPHTVLSSHLDQQLIIVSVLLPPPLFIHLWFLGLATLSSQLQSAPSLSFSSNFIVCLHVFLSESLPLYWFPFLAFPSSSFGFEFHLILVSLYTSPSLSRLYLLISYSLSLLCHSIFLQDCLGARSRDGGRGQNPESFLLPKKKEKKRYAAGMENIGLNG